MQRICSTQYIHTYPILVSTGWGPGPGAKGPEPGAQRPEPGAQGPEPGAQGPGHGAPGLGPGAQGPGQGPGPGTRGPGQGQGPEDQAWDLSWDFVTILAPLVFEKQHDEH